MFGFDARKRFLLAAGSTSLLALAARPAEAQIGLTPGDVALVGWVDNGTPDDRFALVALADLPAGSVIYFTDNGWDGVSGAFRNTNGPNDGDGNETLLKLTVNTTVPAGTILDTTQVSAAFTWTTTGAIPGTTSGSFGSLVLSQSGDQIYAFQQDTAMNPLNTGVHQHLFALDDTGTFEDAVSTSTGNVPPGLSIAANTATTFAQSGGTQNFMAFDTSALPSGTKDAWLAAIANPANWTFGTSGTLPSGTIQVDGPTISTFCFGDGTLPTACPCGNQGQSGHGCNNSAQTGGARLAAAGSAHPDTIVLTSTSQISGMSIFLQGTSQNPNGSVYGDGLRCASGLLKKLAVKRAVNGTAIFPQVGDPSITTMSSQLGDTIPVGGIRYYQVVYRDKQAAFCPNPPGNTWNVSGAVRIMW